MLVYFFAFEDFYPPTLLFELLLFAYGFLYSDTAIGSVLLPIYESVFESFAPMNSLNLSLFCSLFCLCMPSWMLLFREIDLVVSELI